MSIHKNDIGVAEPYDVQIAELGDNITTINHFIGDINDTAVGGLEPLLNYMNENFFSKDYTAINGHHNNNQKQYNEDIHNIYNVDESKHSILRKIYF